MDLGWLAFSCSQMGTRERAGWGPVQTVNLLKGLLREELAGGWEEVPGSQLGGKMVTRTKGCYLAGLAFAPRAWAYFSCSLHRQPRFTMQPWDQALSVVPRCPQSLLPVSQ